MWLSSFLAIGFPSFWDEFTPLEGRISIVGRVSRLLGQAKMIEVDLFHWGVEFPLLDTFFEWLGALVFMLGAFVEEILQLSEFYANLVIYS